MKQRFYFILAGLLLLVAQVKAQAPNAFNYQGVARNASGAVLPNQAIGLEFTIHQGSAGGTIVYQETQADTTDQFGLFNVAIGKGTVITGTLAGAGWSTNSEYLEVGMDPTGGTNYIDMGTQQFLSVPYALYAANSGGSSINSVTGTAPVYITGTGTAPDVNIQGLPSGADAGGILYSTGAGTSAVFTSTGTKGQVLQSNGSSAPTWVTPGSSGSSGWQLTGNNVAYTFSSTPGTYLGTTSSGGAGFQFAVKGVNAGRIESTTGNTAIGYLSLDNSGTQSTAVGYGALHSNTAANNTAVGYLADYDNLTGTDIVAMGDSALYSNTAGDNNVAVGASALKANTGADNVAVGFKSLAVNTTGTYNTALGYNAGVTSGSLSNATAIGANAVVGESNALVLGGTGANAVNVGIGTSTPNSSLQLSGGSMSLPITVSSGSVNLSTSPNTYTVIITATGQTVTLPAASSCTGRVYIIVAQMASGSVTTSTYLNFNGIATTSISAGNGAMIQSDGTNWDQIMFY